MDTPAYPPGGLAQHARDDADGLPAYQHGLEQDAISGFHEGDSVFEKPVVFGKASNLSDMLAKFHSL
jgi:hypothetical protein